MIHLVKHATFGSALLPAIIWCVAVQVGYADQAIFRLPQECDTCFCSRAFTHTNYIVFRKNGTYTWVSRSHFGLILCDRGTWKQNSQGVITIRSERRLKSVRCGPFTIGVERVEVLSALAALKPDIASFLAKTNVVSFSPEEVEKAWQYSYQPIAELAELTLPFAAVTVAPGVDSVSRRNIQELLRAWEEYLADEDKNLFHVTPIKFQESTFLVSDDDPLLPCANLADVRKLLATWHAEATSPYFVYVMIPYEQFLEEIRWPQPFVFPQGLPEKKEKLGSSEGSDGTAGLSSRAEWNYRIRAGCPDHAVGRRHWLDRRSGRRAGADRRRPGCIIAMTPGTGW